MDFTRARSNEVQLSTCGRYSSLLERSATVNIKVYKYTLHLHVPYMPHMPLMLHLHMQHFQIMLRKFRMLYLLHLLYMQQMLCCLNCTRCISGICSASAFAVCASYATYAECDNVAPDLNLYDQCSVLYVPLHMPKMLHILDLLYELNSCLCCTCCML